MKSQIENFFSLVCLGTFSKIIYITGSLTFHETVIETQMLMNEIKVVLLQYTYTVPTAAVQLIMLNVKEYSSISS